MSSHNRSKISIGAGEWIELLRDAASQSGITLTALQADQMARHSRALLEWNRKINLTAITDPLEVAVKHCLDAIAPMSHIPCAGHLLDLGTGGGFPGIPLKIMRLAQSMTLIDGSRKKINFVKHVIRELSLPLIEALQMRADGQSCPAALRGRFDVVVCRAVADIGRIIDMAVPFLALGGGIFIYQGPDDEPRRAGGRDGFAPPIISMETIPYRLPLIGAQRTLVMLRSAA